jgi:WD40 repeat protein
VASTASEDGQQAPAAAADSAEPRVGKELLTLRYHDQAVTSVAFSPDGRAVLTASLDGTAVLWPTDAAQPPAAD